MSVERRAGAGRVLRNTLGAVVASFAITACADGERPIWRSDSTKVQTECMGTLTMEEIRKQLRRASYNGRVSLSGSVEIEVFNNTSCGTPDVRNVQGQKVLVCGKGLSWEQITRELAVQPYDGNKSGWDGRAAIRAYEKATCPK